MIFEAIIFDMNGTLLCDSELHEDAWMEVAVNLRETPLTREEFQHHGHGLTNKGIITYLLGKEPDDALLQEIVERKESRYRAMCLENKASFILAPGVVDFLNKVQQARIPITIATGSYGPNVDFYFDHLHLARWFRRDQIILDDGTYPGKPAPFVYLKAAAIVNKKPAQCLVFEDSYSGIKAASAAGMGRIIAVEPQLIAEKVRAMNEQVILTHGFLKMDLGIMNS